MLIKIQLPREEGFVLIDNATKVVFSPDAIPLSTKDDLSSLIGHTQLIKNNHCILDFDVISDLGFTITDGFTYLTNKVIFQQDNQEHVYIFDTVAYICNDKGETLEKCFAGGLQSYGTPE